MKILKRIIKGLVSLGLGFISYKCFEHWWNIYNKVYAIITPLQKTLADFAFWFGIVFAVLTFFSLLWTLSD